MVGADKPQRKKVKACQVKGKPEKDDKLYVSVKAKEGA